MSVEKIFEERINRFLANVDLREKDIERAMEFAWARINDKDANAAILESNAREIHDYRIMLNELSLVRKELEDILADVELERM